MNKSLYDQFKDMLSEWVEEMDYLLDIKLCYDIYTGPSGRIYHTVLYGKTGLFCAALDTESSTLYIDDKRLSRFNKFQIINEADEVQLLLESQTKFLIDLCDAHDLL